MKQKKHPIFSMIVLLFFIFLATDIVGKNIFKYYFKTLYQNSNHEKEYRIASNYYHHDLRPNVYIPKTVWGKVFYPIATNSLGFKDKMPREVPLSPDKYRILFIGDSFTEGVGIAYENTFVGIIDNALQKKGIEVLNAAVCSYAPSIYYAKVKYLLDVKGLRFNELVVFIDISDIRDDAVLYRLDGDRVVDRIEEKKANDTLNEKYRADLKKKRTVYQKIEQILRRDTIMTYLMVKNVHDLFFSRDYSYDYDSINYREALFTVNKTSYDEFGKKGLEECAKGMDRLANLCRDRKIILTIAVYPWPDQIVHHDLNSLQSRFWSNWAKKFGVKIIDYFPYFISPNSDTATIRRVLDTYFISGDVHWNNEGHRKVADIFLHNFSVQTTSQIVK
ncbi:MAG TPA: hypothetical protein VMU29_14840 [Smithella sp.]|nr:hypothetical protein [Smithella sp.]